MTQIADAAAMLFKNRGVDLLCLGEVDSASAAYFRSCAQLNEFAIVDLSRDQQGTNFNMALVHRPGALKIDIETLSSRTVMVERSRKKGWHQFEINLHDGSNFLFFMVHWPSRRLLPPETHTRAFLGQQLRLAIDAVQEVSPDRKLVVLGDFNDEPYDDSIARYLCASRDISLVQRRPELLYNPFWRTLSDRRIYNKSAAGYQCIGTYYYEKDAVHRWKTFDQVLFSSSLLGRSEWQLCEDETVIWEEPDWFGVGPPKSRMIDHLPIFGVLEKITDAIV